MANCTHPIVTCLGSVTAFDTAPVSAASRVAFTQTYSTATSPTVTALITDSSTGTAGAGVAAGVGVSTICIPITLAQIVGSGDVLTTFTPGYKFKLLASAFAVTSAVTTAAKAVTLNLEIGTTNVTGGEIALTSANCTPLGAVVAGAAITAANTGAANASISVESASVTAFAEGAGVLLLTIQNMDTADAFATLLAEATAAKKVDNALINTLQSFGYAT